MRYVESMKKVALGLTAAALIAAAAFVASQAA